MLGACTPSIRPKILALRRRCDRMPRGLGDAPSVRRRGDSRRDLSEASGALDKSTNAISTANCVSSRTSTTTTRRVVCGARHLLAGFSRPPGARRARAIYPFKREFVVGAASIDTQGNFSTMCYLPGQHTPERDAGTSTWEPRQGFLHGEIDGGGGSLSASASPA